MSVNTAKMTCVASILCLALFGTSSKDVAVAEVHGWLTDVPRVDLTSDYDITFIPASHAWQITPKTGAGYKGIFQQKKLNAIGIEFEMSLDALCSVEDRTFTRPVLSFGDVTEGGLSLLKTDNLRRKNFDIGFSYGVESDLGGKKPGLFVLSTRNAPVIRGTEKLLNFDNPLLSLLDLLPSDQGFCHTTAPASLYFVTVRIFYHGTNTWLEIRPFGSPSTPTYSAPIYLGVGQSILHYFTQPRSTRKDEDVRLFAHLGPLELLADESPKIFGLWFLRPPVESAQYVESGNANNALDYINAFGSGIRKDFGPITYWDDEQPAYNWTQNFFPRYIADADGDGKDDLIAFSSGGVAVSLSNGKEFLTSSLWSGAYGRNIPPIPPIATTWVNNTDAPRFVSDVNGDKRADVVGFDTKGIVVSTVVKTPSGTSFTYKSPERWSSDFGYDPARGADQTYLDNLVNPRMLADFNGDGMNDVLAITNTTANIALSHETGFGPVVERTGDFSPVLGWSDNDRMPRFAADVTGDGLADLIGFDRLGVMVAVSYLDGDTVKFRPQSRWSNEMGTYIDVNGEGVWKLNSLYPRYIVDVNRDKRADAVMFDGDGIKIALSTGRGFTPAFSINGIHRSHFTIGERWKNQDSFPRFVADVTGDGYPAIVGLRSYISIEVAPQR